MEFKIDPSSKKPLHLQAEEILIELIKLEDYKKGKLLPNEVDLAKSLNISRNTLRQAINKRVFDGLIIRKKGYGTKVVQKSIVGGVKNWYSFSQEMKMLGMEVKNYELHVSLEQVNEDIKAFFKLPENDQTRCLKLERVRGNLEYPFVYFISYFNPAIGITGDENFQTPLYDILEKNYGVVVHTSVEEVTARLAGRIVAQKLEISENDPILIRKRYVYDVDGNPVEYNMGYYRADSFTYTITSER